MDSLKHILQFKIVSILRNIQPENILPIAAALYDGDIRTVEITLNSPHALQMIEHLAVEMGDSMLVGAGTVLNAADAVEAINAGARFIISPIVDRNTIKVTKENGIVSIPGAFTPTEIYNAYTYGADIIKVFPASVGAEYFRSLRGPFPQIPLMPTGGVQIDNISAFLKAGAAAFGIGTALVDAYETIDAANLKRLTAKAKQFTAAINRQGEFVP